MASEVTIRAERPQDARAIADIHRRAFGREEEARIDAALRAAGDLVPGLSLVAEADGAVVGHVAVSRGDLAGRPVLALGPIGVHPARQHRGLGTALMRETIRRARDAGESLIVLIGHPEYYPRFGFVRAVDLGITSALDVPDEVFMALELSPGGAGDGGRFTYPAAFRAPVD